LSFACRQSASDGFVERHHSAVARAREKIGDGFVKATATAGNDQTRHDPGTVIQHLPQADFDVNLDGKAFLENPL
jgi:hypothetical protein